MNRFGWLTILILAGNGFCAVDYGIASKYPKDIGIKNDPAVVFTEDFEEANIDMMLVNWPYFTHKETMSLTPERAPNSGGYKALYVSGGWMDMYRQLLPGYDTLYCRYYTKLDPSCVTVHHWPWLGGHNPPTTYPWPRAGNRPVGNERFSTGVEAHGYVERWDFYTYWKGMQLSNDGKYWGNTFAYNDSIRINKGQWTCIEFMVKMNSPVSDSNGEQAFWINGEKRCHIGKGFPMGRWAGGNWFTDCRTCTPFGGFQWRTVPELKINYFWLEHFVDTDMGCEAWFDDLVISKKYIGPTVTQVVTPSASLAKPAIAGEFRLLTGEKGQLRFGLPSGSDAVHRLSVYDLKGKCVWQSLAPDSKDGLLITDKLDHGVYVAELVQGASKFFCRFSIVE